MPKEAGFAAPISALKLAPSMYKSAPAACTISAICRMSFSNSPTVLGTVSMTTAVRSDKAFFSASLSTQPSGPDLMLMTV